MLNWLGNNIATILISAMLIAIVIFVVYVMKQDKKKGKSPCGGSCGHCAMSGKCHANAKTTQKQK